MAEKQGKEAAAANMPSRFGTVQSRFAPKARARDARGTIKKLIKFYLKEGKLLLAVTLLLLISTAAILYVPGLTGRAVNGLQNLRPGDDFGFITVIGIEILFLYGIDWVCSTIQGYIMAGASQKIVQSLRHSLFAKMQSLPLTYHDTHSHGELMSRLTNDIDNISVTIAASTSQLITSVMMVAGSLTFMLLLSPILSAVTLVTLPLVIILTKVVSSRSRKLFKGQQNELGELNGLIEETITGLRMVKAFNQEDNIIAAFDETNGRLLRYSTMAQIWSGLLMPMMNVITNLGYAFVAGAGGYMAVKGYIAVGTIASFVTYSRWFTRPLNDIAGTFNTIQAALAGAERVFDVLAEAEERPDGPSAIELSDPQGQVEFRNVSFAYVMGRNVLKNVSFNIKKGQTVALVGKTGAGKTTIVNLLTRFYDATSGEIYIDGHEIKGYTRESLMRSFTVVLQDTCLFTGTIADNIRYGRPEAADTEVITAAKAANADPFIRRLKQGYDTMVSGAVDSLSQGQRQLIAIARAVLSSAPILILDEATSSVDTNTELKIQEALLKFREGRTSFVIAHRLSTIRDADLIMVVDDGRVAESGTHKELLAQNGVYAMMYRTRA